MNKLKTHKILLCLALVLMLVFGIILIVEYTSASSPDTKGGWIGLAAMALAVISQLIVIRDLKKRKNP